MSGSVGWSAAGGQAGNGILETLGIAGPAILAVILLIFILRAVFRQRRYRAATTFTDTDRHAVREAIACAERLTVGEILPVVVERSDPHPGADWLAALCLLLLGSALLARSLPWTQPSLLLLSQLGMGAVGYGLARALPDFKRLFIFEDRATAVAGEQAFQEFYAHNLHRTEAATGVLIFVSLLERRVVVMADEGIHSRVPAGFWEETKKVILEGIRRDSLRKGLVAGIRLAGEQLATHFPWREGDRNEIPDRVIVRKE
ncbi:MAG: TPM domain-containing protein [Acidobacteriota bacterium]